ncbi:MAG: Gfo/Idh/MocA family oxidoreductase [Clostridiales bacterium]|nr:Gfo/Idh/MocA family oxidoreductase [Clostridiales bacterium]
MRTIAVVGCGRIAQGAHFPAFAKIEGLKVKYACDLIESKAQHVKDTYPTLVENVITDYNIALADPEVEAVYVLTPNYTHYVVAMDALRAGKHVFCEKPITVNYELSCEMAEEAKKQGKLLNIGVVNRYQRSVEILEQMNREGKFGNIYHVYISFRRYRGIPGLGGAFTTKAQSGGGVLIDCGIHFLDLVLYILGGAKIKNVTCDAYNEMAKDMKAYKYTGMWASDTADIENGTNDVDDYISGYIRTDKASISFNGSWAQNIGKEEHFIDILGDKGGARLDYCGQFTFWDGATLEETRSDHEIPEMFLCEDKAFLEAIGNNEKTKTHIDNILETMKLLDTLYKSAEIKKEIEF